MSVKNIYIPKLRFKGFNDKYIKTKLCDVLFYEQPTNYLVKSNEYDNSFDTPVLTANKTFILGKTNEKTGIYSKGPVIIFDDFTTDNKYVNFNFKIKSSAIKLLTTNSANNLFYLYQLINSKQLNNYGHNRHWIRFLSQEIRLICLLSEQIKISRFFSLLDQQILLLENKLQLIEQIRLFLNNNLYKNSHKNGDKYLLDELLENPKKEPIKDVEGYTPIKIMLNGKGFIKSNLDVKITGKGRKYYERSSGELIIGLQNFHNKSIAILNDCFFKPIMSNAIASFVSKTDDDLFIIKEILLNKNHQNYIWNNASGTGQKEYTIKKILETRIRLPLKDIQKNYKNKFIKIDLLIELLNTKIKIFNHRKLFYLKNIFI